MGIKGFSGSVARKNERSSGFDRSQLFTAPFFSLSPSFSLSPCAPFRGVFPSLYFSVGSSPLIPFPPFYLCSWSRWTSPPTPWRFVGHRGILNRHIPVAPHFPLSHPLVFVLVCWPRCCLLAFHPGVFFRIWVNKKSPGTKERTAANFSQDNVRGPIVARRNANHGRASWLLLGVKNGPRGALRSLSRPSSASSTLLSLPSHVLSVLPLHEHPSLSSYPFFLHPLPPPHRWRISSLPLRYGQILKFGKRYTRPPTNPRFSQAAARPTLKKLRRWLINSNAALAPRGDFSARESREIGIARNREPQGSSLPFVVPSLQQDEASMIWSSSNLPRCSYRVSQGYSS